MVAQWNPLNVTTELLIWHGILTGVNEERVGIYIHTIKNFLKKWIEEMIVWMKRDGRKIIIYGCAARATEGGIEHRKAGRDALTIVVIHGRNKTWNKAHEKKVEHGETKHLSLSTKKKIKEKRLVLLVWLVDLRWWV